MRIKEGQIFNLMDTNGRRNDVINALQGYLTILDDIQNEQKMNWASMPESLAQYEFYRQAIELSPEVFGKHGPYDKLAETLERNKDFATAVQTQDMEWIQKNSFMFQSLVKQFDLGIEDRARHYTSNLVKLGFTDEGREISPVGELLLDLKKLRKYHLTYETYFPEVDDLAEFIFNAKKEGKDIICQCEYGESRSSGCAAAIHEYFYKDGIKIFADYRYYPNQMVYHKVYDALEKYGVEKNVIRESGE